MVLTVPQVHPPKRRRRIGLMIQLTKRAPEGVFCEVGVFRGKSARVLYIMAQRSERELYLYDTFEGHPFPFKRRKEPTDGVGAHVPSDKQIKAIYDDMPDAIITKGIFPGSAVDMPPIAFAHVDVDSWQSTYDAIQYLRPRMARGGIFLFDDYAKHVGCMRAVHAHFKDAQIRRTLRRAFVVMGDKKNKLSNSWGIIR